MKIMTMMRIIRIRRIIIFFRPLILTVQSLKSVSCKVNVFLLEVVVTYTQIEKKKKKKADAAE